MSGFQSEITQPEEPDFDKYILDGHRAGFVSFKSTHGQGTEKTAIIGTIVGTNIFVFSYNSPADSFDSNLPIFEDIIKTVKIIG
jgi:hypothetical protein